MRGQDLLCSPNKERDLFENHTRNFTVHINSVSHEKSSCFLYIESFIDRELPSFVSDRVNFVE